jgi:hypothetical protein
MKKEYGGLGIPNIHYLNIFLIFWIKRYIQREDNLQRKVVIVKYNIRNPNILCCQDTTTPLFSG